MKAMDVFSGFWAHCQPWMRTKIARTDSTQPVAYSEYSEQFKWIKYYIVRAELKRRECNAIWDMHLWVFDVRLSF